MPELLNSPTYCLKGMVINMAEKQMIPLRERAAYSAKIARKNWQAYLLVSPYMILFFIFTVLPVLMSIILSFTTFNGLQFPEFSGWNNYTRLLFNDDVFLIAVKNTLLFSAVTGPISYIACFVFAWIINEVNPKIRSLLTLLFYAPSISGNAYLIWSIIFSGDTYGIANYILQQLGIISDPIIWFKDPRYVLVILMVVQLWLSLGTSFLSFIGGLQTMNRDLFEAGAVDGIKNRWQELWFITLPTMKPFLMFGAVLQISATFAVSDVATALAGNPSVDYAAHTVVTHLEDYGTTRFEIGYASAIATLLFLMMVVTNKLIQRLLGKMGK